MATAPSLSPFSFPRKPGQKFSKPRRHESAQCLTKLSPPPAKPAGILTDILLRHVGVRQLVGVDLDPLETKAAAKFPFYSRLQRSLP